MDIHSISSVSQPIGDANDDEDSHVSFLVEPFFQDFQLHEDLIQAGGVLPNPVIPGIVDGAGGVGVDVLLAGFIL